MVRYGTVRYGMVMVYRDRITETAYRKSPCSVGIWCGRGACYASGYENFLRDDRRRARRCDNDTIHDTSTSFVAGVRRKRKNKKRTSVKFNATNAYRIGDVPSILTMESYEEQPTTTISRIIIQN